MDIKEYIDSGILELYVAGALSEQENVKVTEALNAYPEVKKEVEAIEATVMYLTAATSPKLDKQLFEDIKVKTQQPPDDPKVLKFEPEAKSASRKWISYTGWAAAVVLASGLLWMASQNNSLTNQLNKETRSAEIRESVLEKQLKDVQSDYSRTQEVLSAIRSDNVTPVKLNGQAVSPESYAKAYWNKDTGKLYLDVQGLPEPPEGKVYQLWSLKLEPLTPTSLGTLDEFANNEDKFFIIDNNNASEAFGITLEPAGGSESPTLEQLYTLGVVSS